MKARLEWATRLVKSALPSQLQTVALDVCVNADDEAFARWQRDIGLTAESKYTLGRSSNGLRRLLSLIYLRLQERGVTADKSLTTYLRTARAREQMRTESVRQICEAVLSRLSDAGIAPIVTGGIAAAELVYPEPATRHCHDLDLFLPIERVDAASKVLNETGYQPSTRRGASRSTRWLSDSSGFQVGLHSVPFRVNAWNVDRDSLIKMSVPDMIAGCDVRILSPEHELLHILCTGLSTGSQHSPCWAADSVFHMRHYGKNLDWNTVVTAARTGGRLLVIRVALDYLATRLRAPVPVEVLHELRSSIAGNVDIEAATTAALLSAYGSRLGLIRRSRGPGDIARAILWSTRERLAPT